MTRTVIQEYSTSLICALDKKAKSLSKMKHQLTKGELKELFVNSLLSEFLLSGIEIGTGIIVNQNRIESKQCDIVLYDSSILPAFLKQKNIGFYPAESILAVIEIKTNLKKGEVAKTESNAAHLFQEVYSTSGSIYSDFFTSLPYYCLFGFQGNAPKLIQKKESGSSWLDENATHLNALCLINKFSWLKTTEGWTIKKSDKNKYEETKRFIAGLIDNIITLSRRRKSIFDSKHKDLIGLYIREQNI